jgi:ABC-type Fe3+/spermidine/putrescine transport system ATPase subunit
VSAEALELRGVSVTYAGVPALSCVDLTVAAGEVVALLGPSGSGKSTLLHTAAGFVLPSAGEVWLDGRRVSSPTRARPPEQRGLAMVFQNYALWPHLTALDTVAYPMRRRGVRRGEARVAAARLLEQLHVAHLAARRPAELSGGEQQRVGLARALAQRASLYLFDEPTAHLDTQVRGVFLDELAARRRAAGAAAVYATHDAEEALGLADRVVLLAEGRVQQTGTPTEVYAEPVNAWVARMTGPASFLHGIDGAATVLVRPEWARLGGDRPARLVDVRFRGPHSDYLLDTSHGRLLVRRPGPPGHERGDAVTWVLDHCWGLTGGRQPSGQASSSAAGPE